MQGTPLSSNEGDVIRNYILGRDTHIKITNGTDPGFPTRPESRQNRSLHRLFQLKLLFFHICLRCSRKMRENFYCKKEVLKNFFVFYTTNFQIKFGRTIFFNQNPFRKILTYSSYSSEQSRFKKEIANPRKFASRFYYQNYFLRQII